MVVISGKSFLTTKELSEMLNIRPDSIYRWNTKEYFPQLRRVKIGGRTYYSASSIENIIK